MNDKIIVVVSKVKSVIKSCTTLKQLECGLKMAENFIKSHPGHEEVYDKMIDWVGRKKEIIKSKFS